VGVLINEVDIVTYEEEIMWPECGLKIDGILDGKSDNDEDEKRFLSHLKEIQAIVERLLELKETLFLVVQDKSGMFQAGSYSLTGKRLKAVIRRGCDIRCKHVSLVDSHPYVQAYHAAVEELELNRLDDWGPDDQTDRLNAAVDMIRDECRGKAMRQHMRKLENARKVRNKSAQKLINSLREKYARLQVLRLDLSYRKGKYVDLDDFMGALSKVKEDWEHFRHDLVSGDSIPGVVGYLAKLEYGLLSGFHFHVVVLCDGSKHREDIVLATMLGEHWNNKVVPGREGRYYNCNRHKDNYRYLGIGTLNYYDHEKYSALVNLVLDYMAKTDHVMATEAPGERGWFRSVHKVSKLTKRRGRPRSFTV
jgi:hypothetical protein